MDKRKIGRPLRSWRDEIDESMESRSLEDGECENRTTGRMEVGEGRQQ